MIPMGWMYHTLGDRDGIIKKGLSDVYQTGGLKQPPRL